MKELSEQAATGTYNSDQRLMIDSEFQAMKAEIDRIAKTTDFNGIKLLCNDPTNKMIIPTVKLDSGYLTSRYYDPPNYPYEEPIETETIILNPNAITAKSDDTVFRHSNLANIISYSGDSNIENWYFSLLDHSLLQGSPTVYDDKEYNLSYDVSNNSWSLLSQNKVGDAFEFNKIVSSSSNQMVTIYGYTDQTHTTKSYTLQFHRGNNTNESNGNIGWARLYQDTQVTINNANNKGASYYIYSGGEYYPNASVVDFKTDNPPRPAIRSSYVDIDLDGDGLADIRQAFREKQLLSMLGFDNSVIAYNFSLDIGEMTTKIHFGPGNDAAEDYYYIETKDCTAKGLGIDQTTIETQDKAQNALETLNSAIIKKDQARAYFGAVQNRLENTISNLQIQAENLRASESRISDVDVASEMTEFVRNQILTQTAVAMLSQANSLPQMALQLIQSGG